ncbi:hypothetical protein [Williamsia sp. CHRR-6]|uniref:hypothetical protein n=1 Tax=Williamsia sp. CHRR-6 TaxID=2835871 RepID=UPI001BD972E5|nr:hypothetical protein [Williamsia sp. CHRR-6]MBT0567489.1 hypothetical protein [Williamsia sp. CHRR-6]
MELDLTSPVERARLRRDFTGPVRVAVRGRPGTGRDTVARALRVRLALTPIGPGDDDSDADIWVHVVVGWPRRVDRELIAALPTDRSVVVLGKADTLGSFELAQQTAAEMSQALGRPVTAIMPLLACADIADDEFDLLTQMLRDGEDVPSMAAEFITGGREEAALRTGMLRRLDQFGISTALDLMHDAAERGTDLERVALSAAVAQLGGVDDLRPQIASMTPAVRTARLARLDALLGVGEHDPDTRAAVREEIEQSLVSA